MNPFDRFSWLSQLCLSVCLRMRVTDCAKIIYSPSRISRFDLLLDQSQIFTPDRIDIWKDWSASRSAPPSWRLLPPPIFRVHSVSLVRSFTYKVSFVVQKSRKQKHTKVAITKGWRCYLLIKNVVVVLVVVVVVCKCTHAGIESHNSIFLSSLQWMWYAFSSILA